MDIPDFKTCKVIKIEFNKQIIDRWDSKIDFRAQNFANIFQSFFLSFRPPTGRLFPIRQAAHVHCTAQPQAQRARKTEYRALECSLIIINFIPDKKDYLLLINNKFIINQHA